MRKVFAEVRTINQATNALKMIGKFESNNFLFNHIKHITKKEKRAYSFALSFSAVRKREKYVKQRERYVSKDILLIKSKGESHT